MKNPPDTSADLPLAERTRIAREAQKEIREGIVNRALHLPTEPCAVDRRG